MLRQGRLVRRSVGTRADAHLYYKRAKSDQLLFGPPAAHRAHLAALLGLDG